MPNTLVWFGYVFYLTPTLNTVWCGYMLHLEKLVLGRRDLQGGDASQDKVTAAYNSAVAATRKSHDDVLQVPAHHPAHESISI